MNVLIFGATGAAGLLTVSKALRAGHTVTVFARNPSKLNETDARLAVVKGELVDVAAIEAAMTGQDAVISLLGPSGKAEGMVHSVAMQVIIDAIKKRQMCAVLLLLQHLRHQIRKTNSACHFG